MRSDKVAVKIVGILLFLAFSFTGSLSFGSALSEVREIIATGEYVMGDGETMSVSEERARMNASRKAAEEAGAFVRSYSKVLNMVLEEDVVEIIANHAMKITVLSKKRELVGDAVRFTVKIKAEISNADIDANLKRAAEERQAVADYQQLKDEFDRQSRLLNALKKQLAAAPAEQKKEVLDKIGENETQFRAILFLEEGLRRLSSMDNSGADTALTKAIELNPKLALAYAARAEARLWYADTDNLLEDVNRAISLEKANARYYAVRARIISFKRCSKQNPDGCKEVIADIKKAKSLDPENPAYPTMLGTLYTSLNKYDLAAKEYDRAVEMFSTGMLPLEAVNSYNARADFTLNAAGQDYLQKALNDLDKAVAIITGPLYMTAESNKFARLFAVDPQTKQEDAFRIFEDIFGFDFMKMSEIEKKEFSDRCEKAQKHHKNVGLVYWKRAQIYYEAGDVAAAEKDRKRACELNAYGESICDAGGMIIARDACTPRGAFLPFPSNDGLAAYQFFMHGRRLFARNKYAEAIVQFSRALELDRSIVQAYIMRGMAYGFDSPPSLDMTIADFSAAIELDPANVQALYERGRAYWARANNKAWKRDIQGAMQDRIAAGEDFTTTIKLPYTLYTGSALSMRAKVFETQNQLELASRDYEAAAREDGSPQWFLDAVRVLERAGKNGEAMKILDEYLTALRKELAEKGEAGDAFLSKKIAEAEARERKLSRPNQKIDDENNRAVQLEKVF